MPDNYSKPVRIFLSSLFDLSILQLSKQKPLHHETKSFLANSHLPYGRLRYNLGGDLPSQTTNYTLILV